MPFIFGVVLLCEILQSGAHFEALSLEKAVKWLQLQGFCLWTWAIWDEVWSFLKTGSREWGKLYEIGCWSLFIFQISAFWKAPFCVLEFLTCLQTSVFFRLSLCLHFMPFFFRPCCAACSILVPGPGIEPLPWQWKCWVLNAWSLYILKVYLAWAYIFFELIIRLFLIISAKSSNGSKYFLKPALNQTQIFTQQLLR